MIRYSAVVLFVCVCLLNSSKAQVVITSGNCGDNGYLDYFRCMIQCYETNFGVTGLIEQDFCSNGVQVIIEGSGGVSYTVEDVKEAIECVTGNCQSTVPPSICGDDSPPIVKNLPDDVIDSIIQKLNSGNYKDASDVLQSESRKRHSKHQRSHSRHHVSKKERHHHKEKHRRIHRRKHLLKKLADAYGIKGDQLNELLAKLQEDSGTQQGQTNTFSTPSGQTDSSSTQSGQTDSSSTQSGQTDSSSSQSGQTDMSSTQSGQADTSSTQSGQADTSSTPSGQTDSSEDQTEDELLTKLVEASEKLRERKGASGTRTTEVQKLLAKLVEASGAQTYQDKAAASDLLSKLLDISGLQIGQLNELLIILEEVSGKNTGDLTDVSGILAVLEDDSGEDTDEFDYSEYLTNKDGEEAGQFDISSGSQPGSFAFASGPQSKSFSSAVGPQSKTFASVSGPVSKGLAPAAGDNLDDCEEPDDVESDDSRSSTRNTMSSDSSNTPTPVATLGSTLSGATPASFSTDKTSGTTTSGASGTSSGGSNTGSTPDGGSIDDCYEYADSKPDFEEGNGKKIQSASAVAVASSGSNSAKYSESGLEQTDDYTSDYNGTYDYFNNSNYDSYDDYFPYDDYDGDSYENITYYYEYNSSQVSLNGGSSNVLEVVQGVNLNPDNEQYQSINVESGSASIGGAQTDQNPNFQVYQTNVQNTGGGQNKGIFPNTFSQNLGFNQNPIALNNGVGAISNGQNAGDLSNTPKVGQLQNQEQFQNSFAQTQGINQQIPIQQNQGNSNSGGAIVTSGQTPNQFINSFMQGQGFYPNPLLQQYKNNQYVSGVSNNQQSLSQFPNTPLQPPFVNTYPSNGASVGTIYFAGSGNSAQTPVQNQAFTSNTRNGPLLNIPQSNGFAGQASTGGSNPPGALWTGAVSGGGSSSYSQVPAGNNPVPNQAGIFGPYSNFPQINGGGINSAGNLGSAIAGAFARNPGQNQGTSGNGAVQSQFSEGSNLGNIPVLNIPQYYGNAAQSNGGGNQQISRGTPFSNFASSVSNNGANSAYQGFNSGPAISINSQSFGGSPTNQVAVPSSGNSASPGSLANFGSPSNSGSLVNGGSSASSASFANTRSSGNSPSFANTGSSGNVGNLANFGNTGYAGSLANSGSGSSAISSAQVQSFAM